MTEQCPNYYCVDGVLNIHENEIEIEHHCLSACGYYRIFKKEYPSKVLNRKDFIYDKREKRKRKPRNDKFDSRG